MLIHCEILDNCYRPTRAKLENMLLFNLYSNPHSHSNQHRFVSFKSTFEDSDFDWFRVHTYIKH